VRTVRPPKQAPVQLHNRPKSTLHSIVYFLLLFCTYYHAKALTEPPQDLLFNLEISPTTPTYKLRNSFREFMASNFHGWKEGGGNNYPDEIAEEVLLYEELYVALKLKSKRQIYQSYGQDAFLNCDWCMERSDYFIYILPDLLGSYAWFFTVIGISTIVWHKSTYRMYSSIFISLVACMDAYIIALAEDSSSESKDKNGPDLPPFLMAFTLRNGAFAILCLLLWFNDRKDEWSDAEVTSNFGLKLVLANARLKSARLARDTVLSDAQLKRRYVEFHSKNQEEINDAEGDIKTKRVKSLDPVKLDQIIAGSIENTKRTFEAALVEKAIDKLDGNVRNLTAQFLMENS